MICVHCEEYFESKEGDKPYCITCLTKFKNLVKVPTTETVCQEADRLVSTDRNEDYGSAVVSFNRIASFWSLILGQTISAEQVAQCMIALKLSREMSKSKRDNLVDICGYTKCLDQLLRP